MSEKRQTECLRDRVKDPVNRVKSLRKRRNSYAALFLLWLVLGVVTLITGNITRITYACPWVLLLLEYLIKAIEEHEALKENRMPEENEPMKPGQ